MIDVIVGKEPSLIKRKVESIIKEYENQYGVFDVSHFDTRDKGFLFDHVLESALTVSLFGDKKAVVLSTHDDLIKEMETSLSELMAQSMFDVSLIVIFEKKPLAKSVMGKAIAKHARVHQIKDPDVGQLSILMKQEIERLEFKMSNAAMVELLERVGDDTTRLYQELNKLSLVGQDIEKEHVVKLISKNIDEDIFAISNALLDKNIGKAFSVYQNLLAQKVDPLALLGLIGSSFRKIYQISALYEQGISNKGIADRLSLSEKQVYFLVKNQMRPSFGLLELLNQLAQIDQDVKQGKIDRFVAFELFMIEAII
ncbi:MULTISPECIES: DNA polymerase III subunit delta [Erysipelothrix]|uniref:DNA polymerase III subunit delta n=1 Tax=Erysipelothrix piscisicarius TaxID=2485784 RepID=A0A3S8RNW8_9FIRM|nr:MULTISPECIES: DNA polymerase III subunit delta [Erysipelothrix]AZK44577.1 DNA polymerase III subunit delta [Erysipelothrix piscisicarius]MBK2401877.1 DNA polymerase III subunit delta [Erysipelothrix sp. strain 2 (EsS2-6-Brazil)]MBK2404235.1 DNA polymerase III subunit delta [Erysipelothrix sp. strain 2 (EsS2-7-Brazil)]NBA00965.1 DNA polymerase III subunit delta [Erysipelothrix rhusiopathiae]